MARFFHSVLWLLVASGTSVIAQKPWYYTVQVPELADRLNMKMMYAAVASWDPGWQCTPDTIDHTVDLIGPVALNLSAFTELLAAHGLTAATISRTDEEGSTLPLPNPNAFPVFIDTGDPDQDQEVYAAAKAAWIASHPNHSARESADKETE